MRSMVEGGFRRRFAVGRSTAANAALRGKPPPPLAYGERSPSPPCGEDFPSLTPD